LSAARRFFRSIFEGSHQGIQLWTQLEPHLSSTRIEITTGIAEATAIPWELIRNPHTKTNLALSAEAFVRTQTGRAARRLAASRGGKGPHSSCHLPAEGWRGRAVSFGGRSPGDGGLREGDRESFQLDVLRPPTYEQLAKTLELAKGPGQNPTTSSISTGMASTLIRRTLKMLVKS